jgi:hypothetical protein
MQAPWEKLRPFLVKNVEAPFGGAGDSIFIMPVSTAALWRLPALTSNGATALVERIRAWNQLVEEAIMTTPAPLPSPPSPLPPGRKRRPSPPSGTETEPSSRSPSAKRIRLEAVPPNPQAPPGPGTLRIIHIREEEEEEQKEREDDPILPLTVAPAPPTSGGLTSVIDADGNALAVLRGEYRFPQASASVAAHVNATLNPMGEIEAEVFFTFLVDQVGDPTDDPTFWDRVMALINLNPADTRDRLRLQELYHRREKLAKLKELAITNVDVIHARARALEEGDDTEAYLNTYIAFIRAMNSHWPVADLPFWITVDPPALTRRFIRINILDSFIRDQWEREYQRRRYAILARINASETAIDADEAAVKDDMARRRGPPPPLLPPPSPPAAVGAFLDELNVELANEADLLIGFSSQEEVTAAVLMPADDGTHLPFPLAPEEEEEEEKESEFPAISEDDFLLRSSSSSLGSELTTPTSGRCYGCGVSGATWTDCRHVYCMRCCDRL